MAKLHKNRVGADLSSVKTNFLLSRKGSSVVWEKSLSLGGTNECVDFGNVLDQDGTDPFTFSVWIKAPTPLGTSSIFSKLVQAGNFPGYEINLFTGRTIDFIIRSTGTNLARRQGTDTITADTWTHLIFTYDGSQDAVGLKWYFNNVEETGYSTISDSLSTTSTSPANLFLGCRDDVANHMIGIFKEFYFWPSVISSDDRAFFLTK